MMEPVNSKYQRTTTEQLECFLEFIRQHPEIQSGKNDPTNPRRIQELWEAVATELNALKGQERTAQKWKESLNHWKNQLRSRARKSKAAAIATGGGPAADDNMNSFEKRALAIFGNIVVDGLKELPILGTEETVMSTSDVDDTTFSEIYAQILPDNAVNVESGCRSSTPKRKRPNNNSDAAIMQQVLEMMQRREEREMQLHTQLLEQQKVLINVFEKVGQLINTLSDKIEKL